MASLMRLWLLGGAVYLTLAVSCTSISERNGPREQSPPQDAGILNEATPEAEGGPESVLSRALAASPAETSVLHEEGSPVAALYDLNGDRREDAVFLTVRDISTVEAPMERLYHPPRPPQIGQESFFFVLEYGLTPLLGSIDLRSISLGSHPAARSFAVEPLSDRQGVPVAVTTEFYTAQGIVEVWTVFQRRVEPTTFTLRRDPNADYESFDIDNDGVREVITIESRFEEGRGFETYMNLHELTEGGFEATRTINVVRNLRDFLESIRRDLLTDGWGSPEELDRYFQPADEAFAGAEAIPLSYVAELGIDDVLLPQILENPFFSLENREVVSLPINIVCCEGAFFSYILGVRFQENPFVGEHFELVP